MNDQEIFDMLVADAPTPRAGHVTQVLRQAHRTRRRQRLAGAGTGLGVVALSVVAATALASTTTVSGQRTVEPGAIGTSSTIAQTTEEAGPYAAAARALAEEVREGGPRWRILYVLDHTCANVITPTEGACDPTPLPGSLRAGLVADLADYAPVRFVADGESVTGPDLVVKDGGALVTFGPVHSRGGGVQVSLAVRHTGLSGRGLTYQVVRRDGGWKVDGTVGPMWIN
jgi:hypothetical protein